MNIKSFIGGAVVAAVVGIGAYFIGIHSVAVTGGDFAGGQQPSQLFTGNAAGGYVAPVGSLALGAPNGIFVGGLNSYNEFTSYVSASGTPSAVVTLGPLNSTTSTATTTITLSYVSGLSIGAICSGGSATTTVYVSGCLLTSTNGVTGTAMIAYSNITGSSLSVPTSTLFRITFDQLPY